MLDTVIGNSGPIFVFVQRKPDIPERHSLQPHSEKLLLLRRERFQAGTDLLNKFLLYVGSLRRGSADPIGIFQCCQFFSPAVFVIKKIAPDGT